MKSLLNEGSQNPLHKSLQVAQSSLSLPLCLQDMHSGTDNERVQDQQLSENSLGVQIPSKHKQQLVREVLDVL